MNDILRMEENQVEEHSVFTLLPRSPWSSQVSYLRLIFRAKKALDRIEKEAGFSIND